MFAPGLSWRNTKRWLRKNGVPNVKIKCPQDYIHPRHIRDRECECGYPRIRCVTGRKWVEGEKEYQGNYCAVLDRS